MAFGIGRALKKTAGSGALGLAGKALYKKDGSTRNKTALESVAGRVAGGKGAPEPSGADAGEGAPTGRPTNKGMMRSGLLGSVARNFYSRPEVQAQQKSRGMKAGGAVSKRIDGCATKGKTKATMVKMASGKKR